MRKKTKKKNKKKNKLVGNQGFAWAILGKVNSNDVTQYN